MAFPTTSIQDNFNRADGGLGANWTKTFSADLNLAIATNQVKNGGTTSGSSAQMTSLGALASPIEAYIDIPSITESVGLDYLMSNIGTASVSGYRVQTSTGNTLIKVFRIDNGAFTQIGASITQTVSAGDSLGIAVSGTTHTVWYKPSAGSWTSLGTVTDATYASGSIGILIDNANTLSRIDNFGGGAVVTATKTLALLGVGS